MVLGAAGAIGSQDADSGVSAVRVSAGLYTLTFPAAYKKLIKVVPTIVGTGAAGTGSVMELPLATQLLTAGTKVGTLQVLFKRSDTMVAADLPNPTTLILDVTVEEGV
jgi:hypothetical protein